MEKNKPTNVNYKVLSSLSGLMKNIGTEKHIVTRKTYETLVEDIEDPSEIKVINELLAQLLEINEQMENMNWLNKHYRILHEFAQICSKTLNESILLRKAYEMVSQVMPTDSFYIALYTEGETHIHLVFLAENGEVYPQSYIELGDNYTSKVIKTREIIHQKKASQAVEYNVTIGENETSSCIFLPVIIDDHVKGVISAQSNSDFAYRKEHEELLQIIGTQVINSIETARLYEKIYKMSQTDELTGLKNHRAFHEDLFKLIREKNQEIILIMIDSDNLKEINDEYGHDIGDSYLKVLADGIKHISGTNIEGYRYAGDEFMILITTHMPDGIKLLYENLKQYFLRNHVTVSDNKLYVSFSTGVAFYPDHGSSVDSLKKSADTALYVAKNQGKNQLVIAEKK